jgi:predicted RNA-binding Zn-ribbon protein involved in translation (DUF1610 family)
MAGIPAKCLACGQILHFDGAKSAYYCPECDVRTSEAMKPEEVKKAA